MTSLMLALLLPTIAGLAIPLGGLIASVEHIQSKWLETELRHTIIAFGGGVLIAAVSLVLIPAGIAAVSPLTMILTFTAGGIFFFLADWAIAARGQSTSQLLAMFLDFLPEALALGAALATGEPVGLLLALMIALQNLPEGFNAFREIRAAGKISDRSLLYVFLLMAFLGPLLAFVGHEYLRAYPAFIGSVMLFSAGGIIYLTFEDIAPGAYLKNHRAPPLGAVAGFLVGLIGHVLIV